ncbi:glyoxal reductase [Secundilactobacillus paracollinoides]|uniref:Glyoxal reductase n=2 Tax=Secundilactobacillus paracollinoides TaxID=240427 RepID=A0A1B2IWE7_9LACO|nr:glyoxal reductase [Secundilactobacillus paracollinoides]ANZ64822.1 glyoxal reductase [Secundilactobacillus paracollinoides]ANZ66338.1 glyoxal reductase [Secundilactobacillus paracollinoides]
MEDEDMTTKLDTVKLADGNEMPTVGFGTYLIDTQELMDSTIKTAYETGYRLFDTAQLYRNEDLLGDTLAKQSIPRDQIFITSKVAEISQGFDNAIASIDDSLKRLKTSYLDLVMVHWPVHDHFFETWKALEQLKKDGKVKSIGVANFELSHLELLKTQAEEMPVVNQIECHPYLSQKPLIEFDKENDIVTQAWSPLGRGVVLDDPMLKKMAAHHNVSVAQLVLRWHTTNGVTIIPKSKTPERIQENIQLDFDLTEDEIDMINIMNRNQRTGREPELVYELGKQYKLRKD